EFVDVSCKDGNESSIDNLLEQIKTGVRKLPQVGDELPKAWVDIRNSLETKKALHHISYQQYVDICAGYKLTEEQADFLSQYFHDLGIIVHYQKDPLLKKMVVIDPDWVVDAVYNVLDTPAVEQNNGKFCHQDLEDIWQDDKYKDKLPELLAIMNRYELCFQLGNSGIYIAPELLPANPKAYNPIEPEGRMTFIYQFEFMPAGLLTRFIVKIHKLIVEELFWKYGVNVAVDGAKASIIADEQKRQIRVDIEGKKDNKKALLAIIRRDFGDIFDDFNRKVNFDELVPCNCQQCSFLENSPHFFKWQSLLNYKSKGRNTIVCDKSCEDVNIEQLSGEIEDRIQYKDTFRISASGNLVHEFMPDTKKDNWWQVAGLAGIAASLIALILLYFKENIYVTVPLTAGVIAALIVLWSNPKKRFMRRFGSVFVGFGLFNILPGMKFMFEGKYDTFFGQLDSFSTPVNIALIILMIVLAGFDYKAQK
ncbi:MAG: hypothetical protein MJK04_07300, partial [Psychrosphaera sp.]|nr:hypothetical protein [Psychrosphaera sp.]